MPLRVNLIWAMGENRVIGDRGRIPWRLSEDLKRFRRITTGHVVIMGRKTWESLGKPLPDRTNVVVTRRRDYDAPGALVAGSLDEALEVARDRGDAEPFVIGGGEIYGLALPRADRLHLTLLHRVFEGDATFPDLDLSEWREVEREEHERPPGAPGEAPLRYSFVTLERA